MKSKATRELNVGLAALAGMLVLTALVAIQLLERMSPAVTRVVDENVSSLHASSEMLAALAAQRLPEQTAAAARQRFADALAAAASNQTHAGEAGPIAELREVSAAALAGDPRALERALAAIAALERANQAAMQVASVDARRLGTAGAWALALLGLVGFAAGSVVRRRLQRRVTAPMLELERVLLSVEGGDRLQRCGNAGHSAEQQRALRALNRLLDMVESQTAKPFSAGGPAELVPWLLDAGGDALAVVDRRGGMVSASRAVLEMLSDERDEQLLERLQRAAQGSNEERVKVIRRSERFALLAIAQPGH
jgi:PAS domain-containing protein